MTPPAPETNVSQVAVIPGEPTSFRVSSKSHPGQHHMVDIAAHHGNGKCSCIRWDTVCWPRIRDTGHLPPGLRCRHLKASREMAMNLTIKLYLAEHP